jgi:hypothetical protein
VLTFFLCTTRACCTSEDECKWFTAIWLILLKQSKNKMVRYWIWCHGILLLFTYKMVIIHNDYILCARWILLVTPDSSSSLPGCSMRVLAPPLLLINYLSCSPPGGPGPPPFPPPGLTPFPSGSRHLPTSLLASLTAELSGEAWGYGYTGVQDRDPAMRKKIFNSAGLSSLVQYSTVYCKINIHLDVLG